MKIIYIQNSKDLRIYIKKQIQYSLETKFNLNNVPSLAIKIPSILEKEVIDASKNYGVFAYTDCIKYSFLIGQKQSIFELLKATKPKIAKDIILSINNFDEIRRYDISYNQKILPLSDKKPLIMGVLNITQDSFYEKSRTTKEQALEKVAPLIDQGADIIDLGPQSTRPGASEIPPEEEISKVLEILKKIKKEFKNIWISIDTYYAKTAQACLDQGADIINDISGGDFDKDMLNIVAKYNCPYIIGHSPFKPSTWQNMEFNYDDIVLELTSHFKKKIEKLYDLGYNLYNGVIVDPCVGFSKSPIHNIEILNQIESLRILGKPILIGTSRKSFIGVIIKEFLNKEHIPPPEERLIGSLGSIAQSVVKNACNIVRTHDVVKTKEFVAVIDAIRNYHYV